MSIHAQLTPEAAQRLRAQQRNSTIASIIISILAVVLVFVILAILVIKGITITQPDIVSYTASSTQEEVLETTEVNTSLQRKPSAPSSNIAKVIAANTASPTAIPVPDVNVTVPTTDFGNGNDFATGWGSASEDQGGGFGAIPAQMRKRCSKQDRLQRLAENGGNEQCEEAVLSALRWLKDNQKSNGSWGGKKPVAMTGLAILAYLGHCETPLSEEFGESVTKGMVFLVDNNMKQKGKSASNLQDRYWCYEHAMALYALCESYTFCKQLNLENLVPNIEPAVQNGIDWIIDNQERSGGWDYSYDNKNDRNGDSSIAAWHLQALKAAKSTGLKFTGISGSIGNGLDFLEKCQHSSGGFGYDFKKRPAGRNRKHYSLTGAASLCFQQHKGIANSQARAGIKYINENSSFSFSKKTLSFYEHYYVAQAMINHGGDSWTKYNNLFRDELLKNQNKDGSFPDPKGPHSYSDPVYNTALGALMLEVYYRFLPGTGTAQ